MVHERGQQVVPGDVTGYKLVDVDVDVVVLLPSYHVQFSALIMLVHNVTMLTQEPYHHTMMSFSKFMYFTTGANYMYLNGWYLPCLVLDCLY
jgi:hypothetical protein